MMSGGLRNGSSITSMLLINCAFGVVIEAIRMVMGKSTNLDSGNFRKFAYMRTNIFVSSSEYTVVLLLLLVQLMLDELV